MKWVSKGKQRKKGRKVWDEKLTWLCVMCVMWRWKGANGKWWARITMVVYNWWTGRWDGRWLWRFLNYRWEICGRAACCCILDAGYWMRSAKRYELERDGMRRERKENTRTRKEKEKEKEKEKGKDLVIVNVLVTVRSWVFFSGTVYTVCMYCFEGLYIHTLRFLL